jgi:hypothetical protein
VGLEAHDGLAMAALANGSWLAWGDAPTTDALLRLVVRHHPQQGSRPLCARQPLAARLEEVQVSGASAAAPADDGLLGLQGRPGSASAGLLVCLRHPFDVLARATDDAGGDGDSHAWGSSQVRFQWLGARVSCGAAARIAPRRPLHPDVPTDGDDQLGRYGGAPDGGAQEALGVLLANGSLYGGEVGWAMAASSDATDDGSFRDGGSGGNEAAHGGDAFAVYKRDFDGRIISMTCRATGAFWGGKGTTGRCYVCSYKHLHSACGDSICWCLLVPCAVVSGFPALPAPRLASVPPFPVPRRTICACA